MSRRLQCSALIIGILMLSLVGGMGLWLRSAQRQYGLNRALIAALVHHDTRQALALVEAGADPDTQYDATLVPSLPDLMRHLFHRLPFATNDSPTALSIA